MRLIGIALRGGGIGERIFAMDRADRVAEAQQPQIGARGQPDMRGEPALELAV